MQSRRILSIAGTVVAVTGLVIGLVFLLPANSNHVTVSDEAQVSQQVSQSATSAQNDLEKLKEAYSSSAEQNDLRSATTTLTRVHLQNLPPRQQAWILLPVLNRAGEYSCLNDIINDESGWRVTAENASGAYGIPQALPGWKMAGPWGGNWESSSYVQLFWMIRVYIPGRYGTPCGAWNFHMAHGWY